MTVDILTKGLSREHFCKLVRSDGPSILDTTSQEASDQPSFTHYCLGTTLKYENQFIVMNVARTSLGSKSQDVYFPFQVRSMPMLSLMFQTTWTSLVQDPSTCVPPELNRSMLAVWEELWHVMPQSGKVSAAVNTLLQHYQECCRAKRKSHTSDTPPALLPVSFAHAKDWLIRRSSKPSRSAPSTRRHERLLLTSTIP